VPIKEIGRTIHAVGDKYGYGVVKVFVGHGVGTVFHSWPHVSHTRWVGAGASQPPNLAWFQLAFADLPAASHTHHTCALLSATTTTTTTTRAQEQRAGLAAEGDDLYN
jgi:hypothetical protein